MNDYIVRVNTESGEAVADFGFTTHDDLKRILAFMTEKGLFGGNQQEIEQFAIGLKLFTGVLMKHRDEPLFQELDSAIGAFMRKLKGK